MDDILGSTAGDERQGITIIRPRHGGLEEIDHLQRARLAAVGQRFLRFAGLGVGDIQPIPHVLIGDIRDALAIRADRGRHIDVIHHPFMFDQPRGDGFGILLTGCNVTVLGFQKCLPLLGDLFSRLAVDPVESLLPASCAYGFLEESPD